MSANTQTQTHMQTPDRLRRLMVGLALIAATGLLMAGMIGVSSSAKAQAGAAQVAVGTYEPQTAFNAYFQAPGVSDRLVQLQSRVEQLHQQGDAQEVAQVQMALQEEQQNLVQNFQEQVEQHLPQLAEDQNISVVAVQVVYTRPDVQTHNLTEQLVERLANDDNDDQ